jgi:membrane associated rhomboid family serine protease
MFAAAIPGLRRSVVRLEQRRREGLPEETAAEIKLQARSTGHAALDAHLSSTAWGTNGAGLVIVLVSVAAWVAPDGRLLLLLAKDNEAVRDGEVWRLLTVALVHSGLMHLVFNVSILLDVGATLERLAGTSRMLVVLIVGTAAGSALSVAVLPQLSVGASGGVLALAAALVSLGIRHRAELPAGARKKLVRAAAELVALNVVLTFVLSNVDWAAHLGGIVAGAVIGWSSRLSPAARRALAGPPGPDAGVVAMPGARPEGR